MTGSRGATVASGVIPGTTTRKPRGILMAAAGR